MRNGGILRNDSAAHDYLAWFLPFLLERTGPGEHVLVYCKKRLLEFGVHKATEFDDSGNRRARYSAADLRRLNSGTIRDTRVQQAQAAHLATTNKQDAARTCIRHLDDDGRAAAADLYMVDCDLAALMQHRDRMFPGAKEYTVLTCGDPEDTAAGSPRDGAAARVAHLLLTTNLGRLTVADLTERCGVRVGNYARTLATAEVRDAMSARGWREVTRKFLNLHGRGKVLIRDAA
jgi:hypothetical protein